MIKIDPAHIKGTIVAESFLRESRYAFQLTQKGASLRLMSGLMCLRNYGSVYKRLIDKNENMQRENRRGVSRYEKKILLEWELSNPLIAEAMKVSGITPRIWCSYYGFFTDSNYADLFALYNSQMYEICNYMPSGTILAYLREDFPEAFGLKLASYRPAVVDPDLFFHYEREYPCGNTRHIFRVDSLKIKVINASDFLGYATYKKKVRQEIRIQRMVQLLEIGLSPQNIQSALAWLPEDISKSRTPWYGENQGSGHKAMRAAEKAYQNKLDERSTRPLANE